MAAPHFVDALLASGQAGVGRAGEGLADRPRDGRVDTTPSEVIRVLIEKNLDAKEAPVYQRYAKLMGWADAARRLRVRANADQPDQSEAAVAFGVPLAALP